VISGSRYDRTDTGVLIVAVARDSGGIGKFVKVAMVISESGRNEFLTSSGISMIEDSSYRKTRN
jgi:hypothetical protein